MNKMEYLKQAIAWDCHKRKAWLVSSFAVLKESTDKFQYPGQLIKQSWGYSFYDPEQNVIKIDDSTANGPLMSFKDRIPVDASWCPNATSVLDTNLGNLIFNLLAIVPAFGSKMPFVLGSASIKKIENAIAARLQDTPTANAPRSTEFFYVDEYVQFVNSLQYLSSLTQLVTYAATPKNIRAPDGVLEFKKQLMVKYGDTISDPIILSKFEGELKAFDDRYLSDDPSNNKFVSGKIKDNARKKMYLAIGAEKGFSDDLEAKPITNSLDQGWPTEPEQFAVLMDSSRSGSFSRGSETVKGGVSAKVLLRAANNFRIHNTDCGTALGIRRKFDSSNIEKIIGRYIILQNKPVLIENKNDADNYLNKDIIVRSPLYCKLEGDNMCTYCVGSKLSQFPDGLAIPVTEISSVILNASLKAMHSQVLSTAKIDITKHFT